ncbi:DinB family protein [Streptacidiphilus sp. 4-A2]|nr:DinB family protein [Streptacidiphilus sp. 4-A2]
MKCAGLDQRQLREESVPPSTLSLLGLVQHLTEVERHWFRRVLTGEELPKVYGDGNAAVTDEQDISQRYGSFEVAAEANPEQALAAWRSEIQHADANCAGLSLDATGTLMGQTVSLRWIYVHMIEEYARHNGHADLLRERIDGTTGF